MTPRIRATPSRPTRRSALACDTALALAWGAASAFAQEATHPETGETLASDQTFTYRLLDEPPTIDPQKIEETEGAKIARDLFEGLTVQDAVGDVAPGVATEWQANEDNTEFTFTLREDARWSNGDPVTAGDFVYAWQRAVDPATASEYAWYVELASIENAAEIIAGEAAPDTLGVEAVDERTLKVTLTKPTPYFPEMATYATFMPAHRATIEAHGDAWTRPENIVSNGAYVLTEYVPSEYHVREKSDTYWDAANVIIESTTGLVINDANQMLTRYQAGELDYIEPLPAGRYPELEAQAPDETHSVPRLCNYYYAINLREDAKPELQDPRVRRALSLAVDRDVLVEQILKGGQPPAYSFAHVATAGFEPPEIDYAAMSQPERDAEAQRLMEEAGVENLQLDLIYNTDEAHQQLATVVGQMWRQKLGVDVTLSNYEWQTYLDVRREGQFDIARSAWCGDYNEASTFLDVMTSNNNSNDGRYVNPEVDRLMEEARLSDDPLPMYQEIERILAEDMAVIPLYHYTNTFMLDPQVKGWPFENVDQSWYSKDLYRVADAG